MDAPPDAAPLRRWLRALRKPVAVFCCSDLRALHLLGLCADMGIAVPREVAVLGCDDDTTLCAFATPPLSSIDTDAVSLGREAARMLDAMLARGRGGNAASGRVGETRPEGRISFAAAPPSSVLHRPRRVVERATTDVYQVRTPWLSDALVHIRRHLGDGLNAEELCRHLGYSHTTVNKAFRAELGTSVKGEIQRQRLERACRLLLETDRTASSVAATCGYPSAQHFAHVFAARFGTTPDRWRRSPQSSSRLRFAGNGQTENGAFPLEHPVDAVERALDVFSGVEGADADEPGAAATESGARGRDHLRLAQELVEKRP